MRSEKEKMLAGELYHAQDTQLVAERRRARDLLRALNASADAETEARQEIIRQLFGAAGEGIGIEPPFFCDYGSNIRLGDCVFFNFNCVVLDVAEVVIGNDVMFGPAVQVYTATHTMEYQPRRAGQEFARPVTIGSDVWVGGGAIILPGVTIGARSVIGAGSVVTRDVPEGVFAAGNPCRVIRELTEEENRLA
jgi:maltose O-acetyltransferase